jgi:hypothetical protein
MIYRLLGNFDIVFSGMDGTRTSPINTSLSICYKYNYQVLYESRNGKMILNR